MTSTVKRKSMALVMALLLCFSMFVSFGTTAQAAGERSEIYMVSFPRDAETNRDHWDRDNLQFMNGWYMDAYDMFATFAVGSYEGKVAYCIEPQMKTACSALRMSLWATGSSGSCSLPRGISPIPTSTMSR